MFDTLKANYGEIKMLKTYKKWTKEEMDFVANNSKNMKDYFNFNLLFIFISLKNLIR